MSATQYISNNMYKVKSGKDFKIVECNDQLILEKLVKLNMIDEYQQLRIIKID